MVLAVDQYGILPQNAGEQGVPPHGDGVSLAPMVVVGDVLKGFDVLIQIAASAAFIQLDAPADGQHRLVSGKEGAQQQRLGGIPQDVGLTTGQGCAPARINSGSMSPPPGSSRPSRASASCTAFSGSSSSIRTSLLTTNFQDICVGLRQQLVRYHARHCNRNRH